MTVSADVVLVSDLITGVRQRADMENTNFVTDAEVIKFLDQGYRKFYNLVTTEYENYYVSETNITLVASQEDYDLPSDFYKLLGFDLVTGDKRFTMFPWTLNERNRLINGWIGRPVRYILKGGKVKFTPTPTAPGTVVCYYVPSPTALTTSSQSVEVFNGYDEFIMLDAAIKCLQKEESDTAVLERERDRMEKIIIETMRGRDAGFPQRVTDITRVNDRAWFQWWGI